MTNVHLTIRRSPTGHADYGVTREEAVLDRWVKLEDVNISQRENNVNGKIVQVRVTDPKGRRDFESDPCSIVNFDVVNAVLDISIYPSLFIYGFVAEMGWTDDVGEGSDGGWAYVPENIPWTPGLYQVSLWVGGVPPEE